MCINFKDPEDDLEKALLTTDDGEILTEVPGIVLFDNEETRQFYQDYPDLKVYLPPVVYRENILQMQEKVSLIFYSLSSMRVGYKDM